MAKHLASESNIAVDCTVPQQLTEYNICRSSITGQSESVMTELLKLECAVTQTAAQHYKVI